MHEMPFASVVVAYFPSSDTLTNLMAIADASDALIVVDNTPGSADFSELHNRNVHILHETKNVGLAKALNDGLELVGILGYKNVFLFDQDSKPTNLFFECMLNFKRLNDQKDINIAFFVPNFFDVNCGSFATFPLLSAYHFRHRRCDDMKPYYTGKALIAITSGTLISYDKYMEIGPFAEEYFIDFIDNEYCLRAAKKGLTVAVNCQATLVHAIGNRIRKEFLCLLIKPILSKGPGDCQQYLFKDNASDRSTRPGSSNIVTDLAPDRALYAPVHQRYRQQDHRMEE
jgi:rhamnosyltransferase